MRAPRPLAHPAATADTSTVHQMRMHREMKTRGPLCRSYSPGVIRPSDERRFTRWPQTGRSSVSTSRMLRADRRSMTPSRSKTIRRHRELEERPLPDRPGRARQSSKKIAFGQV